MEEDQKLLIKSENERLIDEGFVTVLLFDHHRLHIQEHVEALKDPMVRTDVEAVDRFIKHIQEHIDSLKEFEELFHD